MIFGRLGKSLKWCDNRSRTYDLRITNALLYQLSYIGFLRHGHGRGYGVKG